MDEKHCLLHVNYILLADTVDRLDMILLELRHLQRNIIHSMHEPAFNAPLRFEEDFLWGGKEESDTLWKLIAAEDREAVKENIILFPTPGQEKDEHDCNQNNSIRKDIKKEITVCLQKRINKLWQEEWRMRYQRSYDHLRGTQLLKRKIMQDKIYLCYFAIKNAGLVPGKTTAVKPAELSQFIILRNAIHQRCKHYLARIMEYQSLFNKVLDIGVKDFPVPSLERRREIGIYMDFLNKRVRSAHKETEHLIHYLRIESKTEESKNQDIILHSWKHDFTPTHSFHGDDKEFNIHHIVSDYYMPERPDLHPMLGHEIAHILIKNHMGDLSDYFFENSKSNFADLIRSIFRVLRQSDNLLHIHQLSPAHNPRFLLKEICCDLLAASVKGFSYLYAMLLELVGADMYKHILSGALEFTHESSETIDLEMINHLYGNGGRPETLRRDWWLRLKLVVVWMRQVHHLEPSGLDEMLLNGVDSLLDNFLFFLEHITLNPEDRIKSVDIWRSLAERLKEEIENSGAAGEVKKWRKKRSDAKNDKKEDFPFPRSVAPINEKVCEVMKKIHIGMKMKEGKVLSGVSWGNIDDLFTERCLLQPASNRDEYKNRDKDKNEKYYINHLYDASWKCALTRTIDLFGIPEKESKKSDCHWLSYYDEDKNGKILDALHRDNAIGRELHSIALEFYMFESENPFDRLVHINFIVKDCENDFLNSFKEKVRGIIERMISCQNLQTEKRWEEERNIEIESEELLKDAAISFKLINERDKILPVLNYLNSYIEKDKIINKILERITCVHNNKCECRKKYWQ
jgi:hypothetical protein